MNLRRSSIRLPVAFAALALVASSCGGSTDSAAPSTLASAETEPPASSEVSGETELESDPTTSLAPDTTAVPETTTVADTTPAPATTEAPVTTVAERDLTLRPAAIGGLAFGAATPDQLLDLLSPLLGNATRIEPLAYPDDQDPTIPFYGNNFEERGFAFPFGTDICFDNGLCAYFGGAQPDAMSLVGYRQSEGAGSLATASGVTAGSTGPDFVDAIIAEAGGCYSTGGGTADGVPLFLRSAGDPFGYFDEVTTDYVAQTPGLADITVLSVYAGEEPFYLYDDC